MRSASRFTWVPPPFSFAISASVRVLVLALGREVLVAR
jgi:hypothetical protein